MLWLLIVHGLLAVCSPLLFRGLHSRAFLVLALAPAATAGWALLCARDVLDGHGPELVVSWVPQLGLDLAFRLDTLSWFLALIVGGVGALVLVYCAGYFADDATGLGRFGGVFVGFAGAMLGLVTADDLLMVFVFWELTSVFSYLLIGHAAGRRAARRAALQALLITTAGGLAMLAGLIVLGQQAGTYRISELIADPPPATTAVVCGLVLVLAGAVSKSALVPLHFWLPAAMAAPTPVSAYLHAAAMVKAGVYLVARFAPAFAEVGAWRVVVLGLGGLSLLLGGLQALRQYDLKLILAFGTVSQLGLLVVLVGDGSQAAALAGLALLGAHAMFKASLFLIAGAIDATTGTRDVRELGGRGLLRRMPLTAVAAGLATASMIGVPPLAGYVAKEAALGAFLHPPEGTSGAERALDAVVLLVLVAGSMLTAAYGVRLWWRTFGPVPDRRGAEAPRVATEPRAPAAGLIVPPLLLAVLGGVLGLLPGLGERLLEPFADTYPTGEPGHLVMWGGVLPFLLTVLILSAGAVPVLVSTGHAGWLPRRLRRRRPAWTARASSSDEIFWRSLRAVDEYAADVTARAQSGSLPVYLGTVLTVFAVLPGGVLLRVLFGGADGEGWPEVRGWDSLPQLLVGALVVLAAVLAARARRRLKAVLLCGVTGYGTALIFMLHGAPDLALTQVLVETVTLVVFVLVLRVLPPFFSDRPLARSRWLRMALGVAVGSTVAGFALLAPGARIHEPVSVDFATEAVSFGGGRNIVNVTLVDIRAWDTMGEISVLLVTATGVASLVFLRRRSSPMRRSHQLGPEREGSVWGDVPDPMAPLHRTDGRRDPPGWLSAVRTLASARRSVMFEVTTRLLFHSMIIYALFLLFSGHNAPGGGFSAGLVVGIALIVRYLAGGRYELSDAMPVQPGLLLGSGLFVSAGVGVVALLLGADVLQSVVVDLHLPVLGDVHLVTSLFFDIGVFLVVIGLVLDILHSLGAGVDRSLEEDAANLEGRVLDEPDTAGPQPGQRAGATAREAMEETR